jgi:hypothetical protein
LKERRAETKDRSLGQQGADLDLKAAALLEGARGGGRRSRPAGEPDLVKLNGDLVTLLAVVDGSDAAPTPQAARALTALEETLRALLERWEGLESEASRRAR